MLLVRGIGEFRGNYPDVPVMDGLIAGLKQNDNDPFFVTLPIAKVGGFSQNRNRKYSQAEVEQIVNEVNTKRPEGRVGHPNMKDRASSLPDMLWLGATIEDELAWGKAYVYSRATDVRDYLHSKVLSGGQVGTSIFGEAEVTDNGEWDNLVIQAIDLAGHEAGISVTDLQSVPIVTTETIIEDEVLSEENEPMDKEYMKELSDQRDELRDAKVALENQVSEMTIALKDVTLQRDGADSILQDLDLGEDPKTNLAELRENATLTEAVKVAIQENADAFSGLSVDKPAELIVVLATQLSEANGAVLDAAVVTLINEKIVAEAARGLVTDHVNLLRKYGEIADVKTAEAAIDSYAGSDQFKELASALVQKAAGGNMIISGKITETDDEMKKAGFATYEETMASPNGGTN